MAAETGPGQVDKARTTRHGRSGAREIKIALVGYIFAATIQLTGYVYTNILVLLAEGFLTSSDILVSSLLLLSIRVSRRPADRTHMFGHGRAQNVGALVAGTILVFFISLEVFRRAIPRLFSQETVLVRNVGLGVIVMIVAMTVHSIPLLYIARVKRKSASVKAQLVYSIKDVVSDAPSLASVGLIGLGFYWVDPIASTIVGFFIIISGIYLLRENADFLMGRAPSKEFFDKAKSSAESVRGILEILDLKAVIVGHSAIVATVQVSVPRGITVEEADRIAHDVEEIVKLETDVEECIVHVHPAGQPAFL